MFDFDEALPDVPLSEAAASEMLDELERNTPEELRRQRAHFRISIRSHVIIQAANSSELHKFKLQAVTGDLSEGGCRILSPIPLRVGNVYRLEFDVEEIPLPLTFVRCTRCALLQEDAFECGFRFFSPITLPEALIAAAEAQHG